MRTQLAHFADLVGSRIAMRGLKLHLNAAAAQAIGLALHELATNAGKYGALSTDRGCVDVGWGTDGDTLTMSWTERDGPPVTPPKRRGFGRTVIASMAKRTVGGEVQLDYAPSGLMWRLTCPAANALEPVNANNSGEGDRCLNTHRPCASLTATEHCPVCYAHAITEGKHDGASRGALSIVQNIGD